MTKQKTVFISMFAFTLTVWFAMPNTTTAQNDNSLPDIPVGLTSFGGGLAEGYLYIYGGNMAGGHTYFQSGQNSTVYRLNLENPKQWEPLFESKGLQGLGMVAHEGMVYRIGGFEARNAEGEDQDLHSVAEFAVLDPKRKQWKQLEPMPEPRSSFDAVVRGGRIYVVGGWILEGDADQVWSKTALMFDLSEPDSGWQSMPAPPFQTRAMSVGYRGKKIYVIGGMKQRGGPTREVNVFDLELQNWSEGPELPGDDGMEGFGNSCFNIGGELVVSVASGNVYKLNEAGDGWDKLHKLDNGRFFHRLLPMGDDKFVLVGGTGMGSGKAMNVDVLSINN